MADNLKIVEQQKNRTRQLMMKNSSINNRSQEETSTIMNCDARNIELAKKLERDVSCTFIPTNSELNPVLPVFPRLQAELTRKGAADSGNNANSRLGQHNSHNHSETVTVEEEGRIKPK